MKAKIVRFLPCKLLIEKKVSNGAEPHLAFSTSTVLFHILITQNGRKLSQFLFHPNLYKLLLLWCKMLVLWEYMTTGDWCIFSAHSKRISSCSWCRIFDHNTLFTFAILHKRQVMNTHTFWKALKFIRICTTFKRRPSCAEHSRRKSEITKYSKLLEHGITQRSGGV